MTHIMQIRFYKKSIDLLSNYKKNTVLVLGDMLELGRYKKKLHKEIGIYIKKRNQYYFWDMEI